jgi:8-oxo-dGTP diphosphatase
VGHIPVRVHVAAAAIFDDQGRVLISQRPAHVHQGSLWEFPGGKLEPGETAMDALHREVHEELGISLQAARPLIRVVHDYSDKAVLLDVWRVDEFTGTPAGCEGQAIEWVNVGNLRDYPFPAANIPIIKAVSLPDCYLITPEPGPDRSRFLQTLARVLAGGISLVQLRARQLSAQDQRTLVAESLPLCRQAGARLLVNAEPALAVETGVDGVHLTSKRLRDLSARPLGDEYLVAASCHTQEDVLHAGALGLDFIVVSPVQQTASHPYAELLGFDGLWRLTEQAPLPVYALGGMQLSDRDAVFRHGAQGIAAISGLWAGFPVQADP